MTRATQTRSVLLPVNMGMMRDKELESLNDELDNYKALYNKALKENAKLRKENEDLKKGIDVRLKEVKAENGALARTIDIYVRKLAQARAKAK